MLGKAISALTDFISQPYPGQSVIPYRARCTYDRRLLVGEEEEQILREISSHLLKLEEKIGSEKFNVEIAEEEIITYTGYRFNNHKFFPAWKLPPDHLFCQRSMEVLKAAGLAPDLTVYRFCTNGSASAGKRKIPTIGFGPGTEILAHTVDEYVALADLQKACMGYQAMMQCTLADREE